MQTGFQFIVPVSHQSQGHDASNTEKISASQRDTKRVTHAFIRGVRRFKRPKTSPMLPAVSAANRSMLLAVLS